MIITAPADISGFAKAERSLSFQNTFTAD